MSLAAFRTDNEKLNQMFTATLESIAYRQDKYSTGGIVESDDRFDNGFLYGYGKMCYPRVHLVKNLLYFGARERARRFCDFWRAAQLPSGGFQQCHWVDEPAQPLGTAAASETDTNGYVLKHWGEFFEGTGDRKWLAEMIPLIENTVGALFSLYRPQIGLCWGEEEIVLKEPEGEIEGHPPGYMMQVNCAIERGLTHASRLLLEGGSVDLGLKAYRMACDIRKGIEERLWDGTEGRYLMGLKEDGSPYRGFMWFELFYPYLTETWDWHAESTFWRLWDEFYDKDPKIPRSYWSNDFSNFIQGKPSRHMRYSGAGPYIGVSAAIAEMLLRGGHYDYAADQLKLICDYTDETNLICEHINTLHPGSEGRFKLYPEKPHMVDRGNLMHLTFFLNLLRHIIGVADSRIKPDLPDNLHELEVQRLPTDRGALSFRYHTDMPADAGSSSIDIEMEEPMELEIWLRCRLPIKGLLVNGRPDDQYMLRPVFSGKSFRVGRRLRVDGRISMEVLF